jgi:aminoglycoside phosphotransferase family enzyme
LDDAQIAIDNHAGNVVFVDDTPQFIDIYLLKREWRLIDKHHNIARLATCVRVLGTDELADAMYEEFATYHLLAATEIYQFMEAYNALIKGYYYTYLEKPDIAIRYFTFADMTLETLQTPV